MIEYDDFVLQIGPPIDGFHSVTVIKSSAGKGGTGRFPASWLAPGAQPAGEGTSQRGVAATATRDVQIDDSEGIPPPAELGRRLFDALFTDQIASLFQQSYGKASARGRRLRIRLQLNVENASIAPLATIPWELMYRHDRREFLVLSADTTLVRSLDVPTGEWDVPEITGPIRVLFVMANPRGDLNLKAERAEIEARLALDQQRDQPAGATPNLRPIVAEFLEDATFAALEDRLRDSDYHIIHFMGHGAFDERQQGHLLFHDGMRSGADLAEVLRRERMTRLVTLNACRTAEGSANADADPFAGVAAALVMAGVPAVVAMQFPVSDTAAIAFSARLYSELGRGEPLEDAVDSGRRRIKALAPDQREWATPVLFLSGAPPFRELVFNVPTEVRPLAPPVPSPIPPPPQPRSPFRTLVIGAVLGMLALVIAFIVFAVSIADETPDGAVTAPSSDTAPTTATDAAPDLREPAQPDNSAAPLDEEQVRTLQAQAEQHPDDPDPRTQLGMLYFNARRYPQAVSWHEQALALRPNDPDVSTNLGMAYGAAGQADRALEQFKHSLSLNDKHTRTLLQVGFVYAFSKDDLPSAQRAWDQLLTINPNGIDAQWVRHYRTMLAGALPPGATPAGPTADVR